MTVQPTIVSYVGDGSTTNYTFQFDYLSSDYVAVRVDGSDVDFTFTGEKAISITEAPASGTTVVISRETERSRLVEFSDGSVLVEDDLNLADTQLLHIMQEAVDLTGYTLSVIGDGSLSASGRRISSVGDPTANQDAVTKLWAETAMSSQLAQAIAATDEVEAIRDTLATARAHYITSYSMVGDGVTNETALFTALDSLLAGEIVDLEGYTFAVDAIPQLACYINGMWVVGSESYPANDDPTTISVSTTDYTTGDVDDPNTAGSLVTESSGGRTTFNQIAVIASKGSKASFVRAVVIASNATEANGNGSFAAASRLSIVGGNSSAVLASEESIVNGRKGFSAGSIRAVLSGEFSSAISSKDVEITTTGTQVGYNSAISSTNVFIGVGYGFKFTYTLTETGEITNFTIIDGGVGYDPASVLIFESLGGKGSGASATLDIDASGTVVGLIGFTGGSGYVDGDTRIYIESGAASYNFAAGVTGVSTMRGSVGAILGSTQCHIGEAARNFIGGCDEVTVTANQSGALWSASSEVTGEVSGILSSSLCSVPDAQSLIIASRRVETTSPRTLVLGNASSGAASTANRTIQLASDSGNVAAAGTFSGSTTFADYAEMFENLTEGEIPLGTIVALEGDKVRPSKVGDAILGVVSGTALIVAGDSPFTWGGRYLTGEFGEPLYEDVVDEDTGEIVRERKLNPDYDPAQPNIPRSERKDAWTTVGVLGQVHVRVGEGVAVGGLVGPDGTTAEASPLTVMRITQPFDSSKGYAVALCMLR